MYDGSKNLTSNLCGHCSRDLCPCIAPENYSLPKPHCKIGNVLYVTGWKNLYCDGKEAP